VVEDALAPIRSNGQWTVVLQWRAAQPFDVLHKHRHTGSAELDAVLRHADPDVGYIDFRQPGDLGDPINAALLRNSADDLEPVEAIVISRLHPGTYRFGVLRLATSDISVQWGELGASQALVAVYRGDRLVRVFGVPRECSQRNWWHVFDIVEGRIRVAGRCSFDRPPDIDPPF
jgi:hypothetical protein